MNVMIQEVSSGNKTSGSGILEQYLSGHLARDGKIYLMFPGRLSVSERKAAVRAILLSEPKRANSWIAEDVGTSMQTVDAVRREMEDAELIPRLEVFVRRNGCRSPRVNGCGW